MPFRVRSAPPCRRANGPTRGGVRWRWRGARRWTAGRCGGLVAVPRPCVSRVGSSFSVLLTHLRLRFQDEEQMRAHAAAAAEAAAADHASAPGIRPPPLLRPRARTQPRSSPAGDPSAARLW
jgi:hypothetical protein